MNEILFLISIISSLCLILLIFKFFGKQGLFVWMAIASIIANIEVLKSVDMFGMHLTLGNVMFASTFLVTDILNERYGYGSSKKAVYLGLISVIAYLITIQLDLLYIPNDVDFANDSMVTLFGLAPRICLSSVSMYFIANLSDVHLFEKLKNIFPNRYGIRTFIATGISQVLENFIFHFGAFFRVYDISTIITLSITVSIIELALAVINIPFLKIALNIEPKN